MDQPKIALSPELARLARHALGLPNGNMKSYRNRFLAGATDEPAWRELARLGLARIGAGTSSGTWFELSDAGAELVLLPGESLDPEDFPQLPESHR